MAEFDELIQALTWLVTNRIQQKIQYTHGLLGDGNGRVRVSTSAGSPEVDYVYVRPDRFTNRVFKVFNKRVQGQDGDPVIIGELPWEPNLIQVVDLDWAAYADIGWGDDITTTNRHGTSHQWRDGAPGIDTFNVYRRQFGDLKTYPVESGTMVVGVSPYSLDIFGTQYQWPGTQAFSLLGAVPGTTGTARMALVYWSPASGTTGYLGVATGTLGSGAEASILNRPVTPQGAIPSAFVRLAGGQQSIDEFDIWDAREPFRPGLSFTTGSYGLSADNIPIADDSGLYTGTTVEAALDQIGFDGARVSKVYESDFGGVAAESDAGGVMIFNTDVKFAGGGQLYLLSKRGNQLNFQGQSAATLSITEFFASDGDGTDAVGLRIYGVGIPADVSNRERLEMLYDQNALEFHILTEAQGTGTLRPLVLFSEGNTDQVFLDTNGRVGLSTDVPDAKLDIFDNSIAQLRLSFEDGVKFADFTLDTNHNLTIDLSSTGITRLESDLRLGTSAFLMTNRASVVLALQSQSAATASLVELFANDGDGTDNVGYRVYGVGTPAAVGNRERLDIEYSSADSEFHITTEAQGTGTLRPLVLFTEGNADQLFLTTGGQTVINNNAATHVSEGSTITSQLHVEAADVGQSRSAVFSVVTDTAARPPLNEFLRARVGPAALQDGDSVGSFLAAGHDGTDYNRSGNLVFKVDGAVAANQVPMSITFETSETNNTGLTNRLIIKPDGLIGIGNISSPAAQVDIDQADSSGAIPVLRLDQGDVDEPFTKYIGTAAAANLTRSIVDEGDVTTATRVGWVKIEIDDIGNQVADGDYFLPFYSLA